MVIGLFLGKLVILYLYMNGVTIDFASWSDHFTYYILPVIYNLLYNNITINDVTIGDIKIGDVIDIDGYVTDVEDYKTVWLDQIIISFTNLPGYFKDNTIFDIEDLFNGNVDPETLEIHAYNLVEYLIEKRIDGEIEPAINKYYCDDDFYVIVPDNSLTLSMLNFPWPASEKMDALMILYLEVNNIIIIIFFVISMILLEILIVFHLEDWQKPYNREINKIFNTYKLGIALDDYIIIGSNVFPIHYTPEEEHFIDMFVVIIPTIIVIQIMIPTLGYLYNEEILDYETLISFDVNIIGNQWFWTYEYIIDHSDVDMILSWNSLYIPSVSDPMIFSFDSILITDNSVYRLSEVDNALVLPVHTNILLSFTSRDVIHSWALPQMGVKVDCIPGRISHVVFSSYAMGVFYGQCSELCGILHGFMPICVEIISFDNFFIWALMQHKMSLANSGIYTESFYTKQVFAILGLEPTEELMSTLRKLKS